jgi:predicted outer membrane repeat protein
MGEIPHFGEYFFMEQKCLAGTQKSGLRSRTLYRVAAVGIATLITQASPGGAASSWGVECLTTNLDNNSYCVTSLNDDIPSGSTAWTLRKSVEDANTRAAASATIGFQDALFGIQRDAQGQVTNQTQTPLVTGATPGESTNPTNEGKIVLDSTLEIKTNITITAPTDADGRILLTIERGNAITSGAPLISVNTTADPGTVPATNQATTEIKIENVTIQSRANEANPQDASGSFATSGVAIQVSSTTVPGDNLTTVTPDVVLKSTQVLNAVSESGGAAINTPGNVRVEGSTLTGNVAITPSGGAPTDGGAIKAGGTVTVVSSALNNNSATGNGGAISASSVSVSSAQDSSNSQLIGNTAGGSGGAISAEGTVSVSESTLTGNTATTGNGGAISAGDQVTVSASTLNGNTATLGSGGAVQASGNVSVSESNFASNAATAGSGGAISATGESSTVAVTNSGLRNNTSGGNGGAISASGPTGEVSVNNSSLGTNTTSGDGGAIAAGGAVTVSGSSVLVSNSSTSGNGGAISAGGDVTIVNSGLSSNTASGIGGAISATGATSAVEITNSGLAGNTAGGSGGAISVTGATSAVEVTNSVLAFNTASTGNGGSVSTTGLTSTVSITNSGLGYNTAGGDGGAIAASGANSTVLIKDTSIAENIAGNNGGGISSGGEVTIGSNSSTPVNAPSTGSIDSQLSTSASSTTSDTAFSASTSITLTLGTNVYSSSAGQGNSGPSDSATNPSGSIMFRNTAASGNGGAISATEAVTVTSGSNIYANTASQDGGAISSQSAVAISNSAVSGNTATEGDGGAISAGSHVTISASNLNGNEALEGHGGAVFSGDKVITSSTTSFVENSAAVGGAIAATTSVDISHTEFIDNSASYIGGAILLNPESDKKSTISDSTFEANYGGLAGGAILGNEAKLVISNTDFIYNSADVVGGAIAHGGELEVIDSTFTGNTASANNAGIQAVRDECEVEDGLNEAFCIVFFEEFDLFGDIEMDSLFGFASGGAIRVFSPAEALSPMSESDEDQNLLNQLPQQTVSILNSDFSKNSTEGDGGAIYFLGLLQILGSRFEENWALLATFFSDSESDSLSEVRGSGGAIYGETIEITDSTFDANFASVNGGAINLLDGDLTVKDSTFDGNVAYEKGGAIYSLGDLNVSGSTFGSAEPDLNPDYNPIIGYSQNPNYSPDQNIDNPSFNPYVQATNPEYNPSVWVENPNYNVSVPTQLPNPNYDASIPQQIRNADCPTGSTIYDGDDFGNGPIYVCEYQISNGAGTSYVTLPLYVANPEYDGREFLDNPQYDDREFVLGLSKPELPENDTEFIFVLVNPDLPNDENEYVTNPNQDTREELPQLMSANLPQDDYKYIYGGNSSGDDGGAIYVEGSTLITNSTFSGNTSGDDGGAIYSEGTLQIKDSSFNRNWAEEDGGAIDTTPGDGDLFITRTSFIENIALEDGGAIYISTGTVEHYDDVILSSLFRGNEAFETGGAINSGYVVLILNTFEDNKSLEGQLLNLGGGYLSGNLLIGSSGGGNLCFIESFSRASNNFATDVSCFGVLNHEGLNNDLLTREQITAEGALHTLPEGYETTLLGELKDNEEFFLEFPSENNLDGVLAPLGTFITNELNKDYKSEIRDSAVLWTAGHLQGIFPDLTNEPEGDSSEGENEIVQPKDKEKGALEENSESKDQVVLNQPSSTNLDSPVLIFEPTLSAEELARISQLRAELLAAERLRQKEVERIAAENLAKIKAAKLARDKARALAAEKRRAQLAALKAKIAATQARGEALKQKSSWINLMKNSPNSNTVKRLVRVPNK